MMRIGDLVKLSAYGKKRRRASWIFDDDIGLVIKIKKHANSSWPDDYTVRWTQSDWHQVRPHGWIYERGNTRRDLAYVRKEAKSQ